MARRLFLHVGTIKSATTYVQAICDASADVLAERGLLWLGSVANFSAVADLYGTTRPDSYRAGALAWPELVQKIANHDGDVLVSNELLSVRGPKKVEVLFDSLPPADVQVVLTARDLARVTVSQWQERARYRPTGTWDEFMRRLMSSGSRADPELAWFWRRQNLPRLVEIWSAHAGAENVTLVTVPPAGSPPGVVGERFFGVVGVPDVAELTVPMETQNQSLGTHSAELIRRIQDRLNDEQRERLHLVLKYILARRVLAERAADEPTLAMTSDQLAWARERAAEMADRLRELGVRVVGDLDDLLPGAWSGQAPPTPPSESELVDSAVDALIGLATATDDLARTVGRESYGDTVRTVGGRGRAQP
jgi:hypothetical protein